MIDPTVFVYVVYTTIAVGLVVWLARTLYRNGEVFLEDVFASRPEMAGAVNRLLVIGFYMLNLGYALLLLPGFQAATPAEAADVLIRKLGVLLVTLGVIHFVNMYVFWRIRARRQFEIDLQSAPQPIITTPEPEPV